MKRDWMICFFTKTDVKNMESCQLLIVARLSGFFSTELRDILSDLKSPTISHLSSRFYGTSLDVENFLKG